MTLLSCMNQLTPEGWVLLSIAIACAIYALYDLDKMNRRSAKEARKQIQELTESEKRELEAVRVMYERSQVKPRTRQTVIAVQLSLL